LTSSRKRKEFKMSAGKVGNHLEVHLKSESDSHHLDDDLDQIEPVETPAKEIEQLFDRLEAYSDTTLELVKLKSLQVGTKVVTSLVSKLAVIVMVTMFLILVNIGLSIYLGGLMGEMYYGYFTVAGLNLLVALLLHLFLQRVINKTLGQAIISQILD
jgi:hypothetical protein